MRIDDLRGYSTEQLRVLRDQTKLELQQQNTYGGIGERRRVPNHTKSATHQTAAQLWKPLQTTIARIETILRERGA